MIEYSQNLTLDPEKVIVSSNITEETINNAFDENDNTQWDSGESWNEAYLGVRFLEAKAIRKIFLKQGKDYGTMEMALEASEDGQNWEEIMFLPGDVSLAALEEGQSFDVPDVGARPFWRVVNYSYPAYKDEQGDIHENYDAPWVIRELQMFEIIEDEEKVLTAPTELVATVNDDIVGVQLEWKYPSAENINFRVFLNDAFSGALSNDNKIILGDLIAGEVYKATVTAYDYANGIESAQSNEVYFSIKGLTGSDDPANWIGARIDNITVIYQK